MEGKENLKLISTALQSFLFDILREVAEVREVWRVGYSNRKSPHIPAGRHVTSSYKSITSPTTELTVMVMAARFTCEDVEGKWDEQKHDFLDSAKDKTNESNLFITETLRL
ncbi:hypothetical protein RRG08_064605 [Elysia crispata]|uniref:Uncharacterized protein n=1 Tax=Elysia crispata TaxID=231223 RepID=A0AAE1BAW1_9GAST|nr:hypothetical protein RRG08_064605 [Elysia crispata]